MRRLYAHGVDTSLVAARISRLESIHSLSGVFLRQSLHSTWYRSMNFRTHAKLPIVMNLSRRYLLKLRPLVVVSCGQMAYRTLETVPAHGGVMRPDGSSYT